MNNNSLAIREKSFITLLIACLHTYFHLIRNDEDMTHLQNCNKDCMTGDKRQYTAHIWGVISAQFCNRRSNKSKLLNS